MVIEISHRISEKTFRPYFSIEVAFLIIQISQSVLAPNETATRTMNPDSGLTSPGIAILRSAPSCRKK